jgi:putative addiction module killer protein
MKRYEIEVYRTADDIAPFQIWIEGLKDHKAKTKLTARLFRAQAGNLGDWKEIKGAQGLFEFREHSGPGYRVFFSIVGQKIILLLAGATKQDQDRAIVKTKDYLADYLRRTEP